MILPSSEEEHCSAGVPYFQSCVKSAVLFMANMRFLGFHSIPRGSYISCDHGLFDAIGNCRWGCDRCQTASRLVRLCKGAEERFEPHSRPCRHKYTRWTALHPSRYFAVVQDTIPSFERGHLLLRQHMMMHRDFLKSSIQIMLLTKPDRVSTVISAVGIAIVTVVDYWMPISSLTTMIC